MAVANKINILLVDDKRENLLTLRAVLEKEEYELITVQSGEEALKEVLIRDFAVILLDVQMPGLNGFDTAKLIKQRKNSAHIPIIFLTALSKAHDQIIKGYSSGAVDYIFKPFNPEILKNKIAALVDIYVNKQAIEIERARLKFAQMELTKKHQNLEQIIENKTKELLKTNKILEKSKNNFRTIFEVSPNLKAIRSFQTKQYLLVNNSWLTYTGFTLQEVNDSGIEYILNIKGAPLDLQANLRNVKITYMTKNNEKKFGLLSTEIIEIDGEEAVLSVVTDVTEQTKLESEISRLDNLNLIGEMAAGIAHEVRNPMTTVIGFLQIAKNDSNTSIAPQYIDLMLSELKRANGIITEFLSLAKDKATNKKLEDLNKIIEQLLPLIQAEALMTNKSVVVELNDIGLLSVDEKEIRQLILNICLNGLEAMSPGGSLTITTYEKMEMTVLEIIDQGPGIKKEVLEKIGTPFYTTKDNGTGLGLAICYSIASRHGAQIAIDTSEVGTRFSIYFDRQVKLIKG